MLSCAQWKGWLHFTRDAIAAIAERAIELKTGARALRAIMEKLMLDILFDLQSRKRIQCND